MSDLKCTLLLFIRSSSAETGPPLGTVLGNLGVNSIKFCKDFNDFTKDLPSYFLLKVKIFIMLDRSFNFIVFLPSIGFFPMFLKKQFLVKKSVKYYVSLKDIVSISLFKFPLLSLNISFKIVLGSLHSCNLFIKF